MTIDIKYTKHVNTYDPVSASWAFNGKNVVLDFSEPITAIFSAPLECVVVEIYANRKLNFYSLEGELLSSESLPVLAGYQFRGINKNNHSKTGVSFLFFPVEKGLGNEWKDIEQYELSTERNHRLGKRLGIYR